MLSAWCNCAVWRRREESEKFLRDSLLESPSDPWRSIVRAISDIPRSDLIGLCGVVILRGAASARVLEKVGMRKEGLLAKNLKIHGEWKSSFLYAILAEEWSRTSSNQATESAPVVG
jgi:hypothetical protein